jgi:hypothetical protein
MIMEKVKVSFRIREVVCENGGNIFYPELFVDNSSTPHNMAHHIIGYNHNGLDYCKSFDEASEIIDIIKKMHVIDGFYYDEVIYKPTNKEIIHEIE